MHILHIGNSSMACVHVAMHAVVGWYIAALEHEYIKLEYI